MVAAVMVVVGEDSRKMMRWRRKRWDGNGEGGFG